MKYLFDLDSGQLTLTRGGAPVSKQEAVSGAQSAISIAFYRGAEPVKQPFNSMWFGFVTGDDEVIALTEDWTYNAATMAYEGVFSTSTDEVGTALGASDSITVYAQLIWKVNAEDVPTNSQVIEVTLRKSVLGFDATTPLGLETPAVWLATTLAALTGKTTPVDADSFAITDSAASNVLKKLTFANLRTWIQGFVSDAVDIVDDLLSTDPAKVLSANQGRVLDGKVSTEASTRSTADATLSTAIGNEATRAAAAEATLAGDITGLTNGKVDQMTDVEEAPTVGVSMMTFYVPGLVDIPANLMNAGPGTISDYADTDGRDAFTSDGTWDSGSLYSPSVWYDAGFGEWRGFVEVLGTNYDFSSGGRTDLTAVGCASWPWTCAAAPELELSTSPTLVPGPAGVPGTQYKHDIGGDLFEIHTKLPDESFLLEGTYDAEGNRYADTYEMLEVAKADWGTTAPPAGVMVKLAGTGVPGCTCVGDGEHNIDELLWDGVYQMVLNDAFVAEHADLFDRIDTSFMGGAREVQLLIDEDIDGVFSFYFGLASATNVAKRFKFSVTTSGGLILGTINMVLSLAGYEVYGGRFIPGTNEPTYTLSTGQDYFACEVFVSDMNIAEDDPPRFYTSMQVMGARSGTWQ